MKLFDNLSTKEKSRIRKAVVPELERYRLYRTLGEIEPDKEKFCQKVESVVSRLPKIERLLIEERYMRQESENVTDFQVYNFIFDPPVSEATYSKIRNRAFTKIALALNIQTGVSIDI